MCLDILLLYHNPGLETLAEHRIPVFYYIIRQCRRPGREVLIMDGEHAHVHTSLRPDRNCPLVLLFIF